MGASAPSLFMLFTYFHENIKKLNKDLWVDVDRERVPYHKEFPIAGLYHRDKYIMGVPHNYVPEYTIMAVNGWDLMMSGYPVGDMTGNSGKFFDSEFVEKAKEDNPGRIGEHVLAKGYVAILSELASRNLIDRRRAQILFGCDIEPNRKHFPKRYLDLTFTN